MFDVNLSNLYLDRPETGSRSISAENPTGERGKGGMADPLPGGPARELGAGWKARPCIFLEGGESRTIMDTDGPGIIRHMWYTFEPKFLREIIIRVYWDGEEHPSVQAPMGDFFCLCWNRHQKILSQPVNVNPFGGMNNFFPMPFRRHVRITVENLSPHLVDGFFYTINYTLEEVPPEALYFHAYWRRTNPLPYGSDYLVVDGIRGRGQYVGTFMAWQQNNAGWWGEGEIKMYVDDDGRYPTICGTGTEDYFGGAVAFDRQDYSAPCFGFQQIEKLSGDVGCRMTLYRFHVFDPVFFKQRLKVTMQALGWRSEGRYLPLQDDIASVAYWYQAPPHAPFGPLPDRNALEII